MPSSGGHRYNVSHKLNIFVNLEIISTQPLEAAQPQLAALHAIATSLLRRRLLNLQACFNFAGLFVDVKLIRNIFSLVWILFVYFVGHCVLFLICHAVLLERVTLLSVMNLLSTPKEDRCLWSERFKKCILYAESVTWTQNELHKSAAERSAVNHNVCLNWEWYSVLCAVHLLWRWWEHRNLHHQFSSSSLPGHTLYLPTNVVYDTETCHQLW
jgi:hypothetical protein